MVEGFQSSGSEQATEEDIAAAIQAHLAAGHSASAAARLVVAQLGVPKRQVYDVAVQLSQELSKDQRSEDQQSDAAQQP